MRRMRLMLLLMFTLSIVCRIAAQTTCVPAFIKEYGGNGQVQPRSITSLPDGNLIVAGRGTTDAHSSYDGLVMKLSNTGTIIWSYLVGGAADDAFAGTLILKDGSLLLYGTTASFGHNDGKAWLVHVSSTGNLIWSKQIGTSDVGAGRMKAAQLLAGGDIICTYNTGDSTANSNAVVCRISSDGQIQWTHVFDNGDNDSFTSLAVSGDTIYAGGFSAASTKYGVIVKINSEDGSLISSQTLRQDGDAYQNEVTGLEVYGGIVSYGLWLIDNNGGNDGIALVQTDMQGKFLYKRYGEDFGDTAYMFVRRAPDNGFLILRTDVMGAGSSTLIKINNFASSGWGDVLGVLSWQRQVNYALDLTPDGGCISAGYHGDNIYFPVVMNVMKMAANGETAACRPNTVGMFFDTLSPIEYESFVWHSDQLVTPALDEMILPVIAPSANTETMLCDTSFCTDKTPLPPGCGKTYRIEYAANQPTILRDAATTEEGEKIVIGDVGGTDAMVMKIKTNGDIAWTKSYEEFAHNTSLSRIVKTADGNWLLFGVGSFTIDHYEDGGSVIIKIDNDGNVIWTRHYARYFSPNITDVVATPDNGFVAVMNDDVGSGSTYSFVIRYDENANMVWQKQLSHFVAAPLYRSITCNSNAVFLAYDSYDYYDFNRFGVDKLDLATGNQIWSQRFTTGNDNVQRINRICQVNDTAYLFVNNFTPINPFMSILNTTMVILDPKGKLIRSLTLQGDPLVPVNPAFWWWDESPPTVTLTPDFDFVLTGRVKVGSDTALNISRFQRDGTKLWSHNFSAIKSYMPFNIHPQGDGFLIMGTASLSTGFPYRNSFLLKVDGSGNVLPDATGDCRQLDRPFTVSDASISIASLAIDSVVNATDLVIANGNMQTKTIAMDATELCGVQKDCGNVLFKQKGTGCSLQDTLVYYLQDAANCDAAATWQYDASYFRAGTINGDSIELMPLRRGSSIITATIEGNCSLTTKQITTAVMVGAANINLGNDTSLCSGSTISLHAGSIYAGYKWNDNSDDSILTVTKPGNYSVTVTDNCGGTASDTIVIRPFDTFLDVTKDTASCNGDTVMLTAGDGYRNYRWSPAYHLTANGNRAWVSTAVTTRYFVSADHVSGCTVSDSVLITALSSPPIRLRNDTSVCSGDSVLLDAGSSFTRYAWSTSDTLRFLSVTQQGSYAVTGSYANGCSSKDTFLLMNLYNKPVVKLDKDPTLCAGSGKTLQLTDASPDAQYQWDNGNTGTTLQVTDTGRYWVTAVNEYGCRNADTVTLTDIIPPPSRFLPADTVVCQYEKLTLYPQYSYSSYLWSDHSTGSSFTITQPGFYSLQVTDAHGCTGSDSIQVTEKQCRQGVYIPTAFTPDQDGHNDMFKPLVYGEVTAYRFAIFDRFGRKVFETQTPLQGWNGTLNGIPADSGTYVWLCQYALPGESLHSDKGTLTLIR